MTKYMKTIQENACKNEAGLLKHDKQWVKSLSSNKKQVSKNAFQKENTNWLPQLNIHAFGITFKISKFKTSTRDSIYTLKFTALPARPYRK